MTHTSPSSTTIEIGEGARRHGDVLRHRLLLAAPLTCVVVLLSMIHALHFPHWEWVAALLSLPVVTWAALPFHRTALTGARHGATTMDTLVSLGVTASTLWSLWALLTPTSGHHVYFEGACVIVTFLLLGRLIEARTRYHAGDALRALLHMGAQRATLLVPDGVGGHAEREIAAQDLRVGDLFLVRPGETVATDGEVVSGASAIDASLLTGESLPVDVGAGDRVTGATLNTWGTLTVRATTVGEATTLARMGRTLAEAQSGKAAAQQLADRVSGVFVPVVLVLAALTLAGWLIAGGSVDEAITAAVAVLVVACPCALGLATPTALLVGSGRASQKGILIRTPEVLDHARDVDTVLLDKTGTLTTGRMTLDRVLPAHTDETTPTPDGDDLLALAAAVEAPSEHPVARAITSASEERGLTHPEVTAFSNHAGLGVSARSGTDLLLVGRPSWLTSLGARPTSDLATDIDEAVNGGATVVALARVPSWEEGHTARRTPSNLSVLAEDAIPVARVELQVTGMTCASCVRRVERKLGKLDGVSASVNLATESALVTLTRPHDDAELISVVEAAGYGARLLARHEGADEEPENAPAQAGGRILPEHLTGIHLLGALVVRDTPKDSAAEALAQMHTLGLTPVLVTGDNEAAARHVADALGIDEVHAQVLPEDKMRLVERFDEAGHVLAMVGDGVNDAPALARAGLRGIGMAMGSGTDVAIAAADITLMTSDLRALPAAIRIARRIHRTIAQNLFWAFVYNVAMIPLAIAGLLDPMIAAGAMAFSSVFVVLNSLRLRRAG